MKKICNYFISIGIVLAINLWGLLASLQVQNEYIKKEFDGFNLECPLSLYNTYFLCDINCMPAVLYVMLIPAVSVISNWNNLIAPKLHHKYIVKNLVTGLCFSAVTLILSLIIDAAFFPAISPQLATGYFPLGYRGSILSDLYMHCPIIYICIFILLISVYSGLFSVYGYCINLIYKNRVVTLIFSVLTQICISRILKTFNYPKIVASNLFIPANTFYETKFTDYISAYAIIIVLSMIIFLIESRSNNAKRKGK